MGPLGFIHQAPSLIDRAASAARSLSVPRGFTPSVHPPFPELFGEAWTQHVNACTGFALAKGAGVMAKMEGIDVPEFSAFAPYDYGRLRRSKTLVDEGARLKDVAWGWNHIGAVAERHRPSHSLSMTAQIRTVNELPRGLDRVACSLDAARWKRELPISLKPIVAIGPRLEQRILHSLHNCQLPLTSLPVGDEFDAGLGVIPAQKPKRGLHLVIILDWRLRGGDYEFLIGNSWSPDWGNEGRQWVRASLIHRATSAFYFERIRS